MLLNNTSKAKVEVLFFNRATKVGSLAILKLMDVYLKTKNDFNVRVDSQDRTLDGRLSKEEQVVIYYQLNNFTLYHVEKNSYHLKSDYEIPFFIFISRCGNQTCSNP